MRCNNCGFDNPANNAKCEKCNAPLEGSMIDNGQTESPTANYVSKATLKGCPKCGYPLISDNSICPQCGNEGGEKILQSDPHPGPNQKSGKSPIERTKTGTIMGDVPGRKLVGFLVTYGLDANGLFFPLYEGRNFVGRDAASDIHLQGDSGISGKHFSILYRDSNKKFKFKDEQSRYGTFVNGQELDEGELVNHDVIRVGSTQLIFIVIPQM
jgi:hypothetical protein